MNTTPTTVPDGINASWYGSLGERVLAHLIDMGISLFIIPIFINTIVYFAQWQTLWYKLMGLKIRNKYAPDATPSMGTLFKRSFSKAFISLSISALFAIAVVFVLDFAWRDPFPTRTSVWIFFIIALLLGSGLTRISVATNPKKQSLHDLVGGTVVIREARPIIVKVISTCIGVTSGLIMIVFVYIVSYITLDLLIYYMDDEPSTVYLQQVKNLLSSPVTRHKRIYEATLLISYGSPTV